jgi:hypothetical protein
MFWLVRRVASTPKRLCKWRIVVREQWLCVPRSCKCVVLEARGCSRARKAQGHVQITAVHLQLNMELFYNCGRKMKAKPLPVSPRPPQISYRVVELNQGPMRQKLASKRVSNDMDNFHCPQNLNKVRTKSTVHKSGATMRHFVRDEKCIWEFNRETWKETIWRPRRRWRIVLEWILKKWRGRVWTGLKWFSTGSRINHWNYRSLASRM